MKLYPSISIFSVFACTLLSSFNSSYKYFEGVVSYDVKVETFFDGPNAKQMKKALGTRSDFFFKNGDTKQTHNGNELIEEYFDHNTLKYYTRSVGTDTFMEMDCSAKTDSIINISKVKSSKKVAGYDCDELLIQTISLKSGFPQTIRFFYNTSATIIDPEWFSKAQSHFMNITYANTKSIPLEFQVENKYYKIVLTAKKIKNQSLKEGDLHLPKGAITKIQDLAR